MKSLALPTALPKEIGLSSARLDRLTQVMRDEVARGRLPGAVALIARRGKIATSRAAAFGSIRPSSCSRFR
jgi:hypothetical protein